MKWLDKIEVKGKRVDKVKAEQSIREQILNICKEILDSHIDDIRNYEEEVREFMLQGLSRTMVIAEFDSCTRSMNKIKNGYNSNEIVRAWRYSNKLLEEIQMDKEPKLSTGRYKNYEEIYARYAFSIEKKILYLNVCYGPLSATGYVYHILEKDGHFKLSEGEWEWVS